VLRDAGFGALVWERGWVVVLAAGGGGLPFAGFSGAARIGVLGAQGEVALRGMGAI